MDPYRSDCSKAAQAAEATAGSLDKDKEQHSSRQCPPVPKTLLPEEVRASNFLDLPGVKLPNIRGSQNVFYTTEIREKRMIEKEVHKFYDNKSAHTSCEAALYQEWLLQEDTQTTPRQERLKKYRYGDLLHGEFYKSQHVTEKRNAVRMKEQERQHRNYIRRKLDLCKQIEDKWKEKEMLLLTKIGEEIRREEKIEEQRRKTREEIDQKKRAFLEKKIARHLEHMKRHAIKRAGQENTFSSKGQDEAEACPKLKKITDATIGQKSRQGPQEQKRTIHYHDCTNKVSAKKPTISFSEKEVQSSATQEKVPPVKEIQKEANLPSKSVLKKQNTQKNKEMTSKSHPVNVKELKRASSHTADCTKVANVSRQSKQHIQKGEASNTSVVPDTGDKNEIETMINIGTNQFYPLFPEVNF
ncbi:fibrous sheath-interacting protein 2-like [Ochotona princeps]|uniref:fibrous sheath-interacting protein 2-like n=1 Tax=Ochotona princeps TaxID=9978 RepID=UPI002714B29E|nr:fibrous sheath-interacting protein 2-like [Ochotona princeps]